mmetsp:Transcript_26822/g.38311  ORF Transcript_26822/g.38311 Transcript_26822/m.38311 type:complete len:91 (-) Transcript_26822:531-803(-)
MCLVVFIDVADFHSESLSITSSSHKVLWYLSSYPVNNMFRVTIHPSIHDYLLGMYVDDRMNESISEWHQYHTMDGWMVFIHERNGRCMLQ